MDEPREPKTAIEPENWAKFLEEFTKRNRQRRARFNIFRENGKTEEEAQEVHLQIVSLRKIGQNTSVIVRRVNPNEAEPHTDTIENVRGIAVQYETDGSENALEITDNLNALISLRFESRLDGNS